MLQIYHLPKVTLYVALSRAETAEGNAAIVKSDQIIDDSLTVQNVIYQDLLQNL